MRVICINDKWNGQPQRDGKRHPQVGDIDEVSDIIERGGNSFYVLIGYSELGLCCKHFATLPDEPAEVIEEPELMEA